MLKLFENLKVIKSRKRLKKALAAKIENSDGKHTISIEDLEKMDKRKDGEDSVSTQPKK